MSLHLGSPLWLWVLPVVLIWGLAWGIRMVRNYRRRQKSFLSTDRAFLRLTPSALRAKVAGHVLIVAAVLLLVMALARPQGSPTPSSSARRGVNLAILVDASRSMLCEDVLPNRLQLARQAVDLLTAETAGSRFSLFMFGGGPTLLIPATFDLTAVSVATKSVSPDFVGKSGTAMVPAIKRASEYLRKTGRQPKVIVIISDGEEGEGDPVLAAMQAQADTSVRIHTITVGTAEGGRIPLYQRDLQGELVRAGDWPGGDRPPAVTHADPDLMAKIAAATGGMAIHVYKGDPAAPIRDLVRQAILPEAVPIDDVATEEPREWWWVCVAAAFALLLTEQALRLWTARRFMAKPTHTRRGAVLGVVTCAMVLFHGATTLGASPERAQALLDHAKPAEALEVLRSDLVKHPHNAAAGYNYALGAYAAGMYPVAIEVLTPLSTSADDGIGTRCQFQLGDANFRLGEQMQADNPAGAAARFEEATKRFDYAAGKPGELEAFARSNLPLAHEKAAGAYLQVARARVAEGDQSARVQPEEAFPKWEASLEFFDKAIVHRPADTQIAAEKGVVTAKLAKEMYLAADRLLKQGRIQENYSSERGIELYRQSIDLFEKSEKYGNTRGATGAADATTALAHGLFVFAQKQGAVAEKELPRSAAASLEALYKAQAGLEEAGKLGTDPAAVATEKTLLDNLWHRAFAKRGDEQVREAAQHAAHGETVEQSHSLIDALASYESALKYQPNDQDIKAKREALLIQLGEFYAEQGKELLQLARLKADTKIEEALAGAEKSVQSFRHSLGYDPNNAVAKATLPEAQRLLDELREKMKENEKKTAKKSRDEIKDGKDLKNLPKDLALHLLDYRNNQPAAKDPQLLIAPENKPLHDW